MHGRCGTHLKNWYILQLVSEDTSVFMTQCTLHLMSKIYVEKSINTFARPLANKAFWILQHQDEQKLPNNVMRAGKEWWTNWFWKCMKRRKLNIQTLLFVRCYVLIDDLRDVVKKVSWETGKW